MFDVAQGLWNSVSARTSSSTRALGLNKILFPTYFNGGNQQSLTDNATGIIYGNNPTEVIRNRDRVPGQRHRPVLRRSGARRPARDSSSASTTRTPSPKNQTHRVDDVTLTYTSASNGFVPPNVTLFATPQNDATALNVLALFAQDSYSVKRLTLIGGLRFEQLEGYLPEQSQPAVAVFPEPAALVR